MSLEKKLGNRRSLGFKIGTIATALLIGAMSYAGCRAEPVNINEEVNNTAPVTETYQTETTQEVIEKSALELKLEGIENLELKEKIENELNYFANEEQKIDYVSDVIDMNKQRMMINYLFDNDYLNEVYNPNEKILWVKSFDRLEFDNKVADSLLEKLSQAENKLDADGDVFSNLEEVSGLDEYGNQLPFISKKTGEPITYVNEQGQTVHRSSSNPLDPKDTPEHMATFDVVYLAGAVGSIDGWATVDGFTTTQLNYYSFIYNNPRLDDILLVNTGGWDFDFIYVGEGNGDYIHIRKDDGGGSSSHEEFLSRFVESDEGDWIKVGFENLSFSQIEERIKTFSNSDYFFGVLNTQGVNNPNDNFVYFGYETISNSRIFNLLSNLYNKYGDGTVLQKANCGGDNSGKLPSYGGYLMESTDSGIVIGDNPQHFFKDLMEENPFIYLDEAHNAKPHFQVLDRNLGGTYHAILGLQYSAKKINNGEIIYWDKNGPFEYEKNQNGNYIRFPEGNIIRNHLAYPKVEEGQGNYIFENGEYILYENGNYIKRELTKEEKAPEITNFFMNELFK
jgi:hypothetical protein